MKNLLGNHLTGALKRALTSTLMVVMLSATFLAVPQSAHAQLVVANPDLLGDSIQKQLNEKIQEGVKSAFVSSMLSQLVNMLQSTVNQMANTTAVWVASGGPAGTPLFTRASAGDYGLYVGAQSAALVIDALDIDNITGGVVEGFNISVPDDPAYIAALRAGIREQYVRPEVTFNFSHISDNYTGFLVSLGQSGASEEEQNARVLSALSQSFRSNDISNGLQIYAGTLIQSQYERQLATQQSIQNNNFRDQRAAISGNVNLPASMVESQLADAVRRVQETPIQIAQNSLGDADIGIQFLGYAGSVFANALAPAILQRIYTGLFAGIPSVVTDPFNPNAAEGFGRDRARDVFSSLLTFKPVQATDYSLISQLSSCPASTLRNSRKLFSCAIDTSFAAAVARAQSTVPLTLEEAIEEGYINGNWALIPASDVARNQDARCYTYGFCEANLVKLRKARIIPVGWELAANSPENTAANPVTLGEVVRGFQDCNVSGEGDESHPWCKLIDPNWVLKAPQTQCRVLAPGQLLAAAGTATRADECVDVQTCIAEDENGNCLGGYGYCVREENTWDFRGDSCPAEFASCLSFTDSQGENVDYLLNTVDYGNCDADDVGCLWRATEKRQQVDGSFEWPQVASLDIADTDENAYQNRVYFNAGVETCNANDAGCSELVIRTNDLTLNLVQNPGFEIDLDGDFVPDGWIYNGSYPTEATLAEPRTGSRAVRADGVVISQYVSVEPSRLYTFSAYGQALQSGANMSVKLILTDSLTGGLINVNGLTTSGGCSVDDFGTYIMQPAVETGSYSRHDCTFGVPAGSAPNANIDIKIEIGSDNFLIDDVQLEQSGDVTDYTVGYSGSTSVEFVKVAPDYLGCTGGADDAEECAQYAEACNPNDAGCKAYSPTDGGPEVTGIITSGDLCPAVCSGYDTYKQEASFYEPNGIFPLHLIPSTAQSCSSSSVGCTEFTNLETEEREYFTYLRACVERDQTTAENVYYTWEGTDVDGFQLKTWNLLESNLGGSLAPCTDWRTSPDGVVCVEQGTSVDQETAACSQYADIFTNPDCREFYDTAGSIHYREWSKTVSVAEACTPYRLTQIDSPDLNASGSSTDELQSNCELSGGYYDGQNGNCEYFGLEEQSLTCAESQNGCRAYTGGQSGNSRFLLQETFESGDSSLEGFTSSNGISLSEESIAANGRSLQANGTVETFTFDLGTECTEDSGCPSTTSDTGGSCVVPFGEQYCGELGGEIFAGKTYTLEFWAKGDPGASVRAGISFGGSGIDLPFEGQLGLSTQWRRYSVGPVVVPAGSNTQAAKLVFEQSGGGDYFLDTIYLQEGESELTLIAGSWNTPAQCDVSPTGAYVPQYHLGCSEYTTTGNITAYVREFSRLCSDGDVGCTGYYETHESTSTGVDIRSASCNTLEVGGFATSLTDCHLEVSGGQYVVDSPVLCQILPGKESCEFDSSTYLPNSARQSAQFSHITYDAGTEYVPADSDVFLIVDQKDRCAATGAGCTELGEFELSSDQSTIEEWNSTYLINDPDRYDEILCSDDQLFCEAFSAGDSGTYYFKDPSGKTCEYRTDVKVGAAVYDGWFQEGSNDFCYGTGACSDGSTPSNADGGGLVDEDGNPVGCSEDSQCRINTGSCSDNGGGCTTDFDCNPSATCENTSEAVCTITQGSFLVGGEISGIYRNGDAEYGGATAVCSPQYNGCSEFQDPLGHDDNEFYGESQGSVFNFINNERLEEGGLLGSQQCNGLVSQEEGCVLFDDTANSQQLFNASATYIASSQNDVLVGGGKFDLVRPIDCSLPSSETSITTLEDGAVDLCSQRCSYKNWDLSSGVDRNDAFATLGDAYTFGGSCVTSNDCANYESNTGNIVEGQCVTEVIYNEGQAQETTQPVPRQINDTNRILKVQRDRMCSEWLTCSGSRTVWDEGTSSFRTVCDEIDLCKDYSGTGDSSFCSAWDSDDPATILDAERYTSRDISWYGEEYSGYAIPDLYPVQYLDQVNVALEGGTCYYEDDPDNFFNGRACDPNGECDDGGVCVDEDEKPDYRLGFNAGSCTGGNGSSCTVGFCESTGAACTDSVDCSGGDSCVTGQCYVVDQGSSCSVDIDCGGTDECRNGTCVEDVNEFCDTSLSCGAAGATCFVSEATSQGSCYNDSCVLTVDGKEFTTEQAQPQLCRAHPETNSPFSNDVVDSWTSIENGSLVTRFIDDVRNKLGVLPRTTRSGFESVNLCAPGEECECSYTKLTTSSGQVGYVSSDTKIGTEDTDIEGICQGGDLAGSFCSVPSDCGVNTAEAGATPVYTGTCVPITREDTLIGMEGYCLEYDTSINVNGEQTEQACLTWLPVDQLAGGTDLNAKFRGAGYKGGETNYCAELGVYADLNSSLAKAPTIETDDWKNTDAEIACINRQGSSGPSSAFQECVQNVESLSCPPGFYGVVGKSYGDNAAKNNFAQFCTGGAAVSDGSERGCPFVCVPNDALVDDSGPHEGDSCYSSFVEDFVSAEYTTPSRTVDGVSWTTEFLYVSDYNAFTDLAINVQSCQAKGIELSNPTKYGQLSMFNLSEVASGGGSNEGWSNYHVNPNPEGVYLACKEVVQPDNGHFTSAAAYTDRLVNPSSDFALNPINASNSGKFGYDYSTTERPFGSAESVDSVNGQEDSRPSTVASCFIRRFQEDGITWDNLAAIVVPSSISDCGELGTASNGISLEEPPARSYENFILRFRLFDNARVVIDSLATIGAFGNIEGLNSNIDINSDDQNRNNYNSSPFNIQLGLRQLFAVNNKSFIYDDQFRDGNSDTRGELKSQEIDGLLEWDQREVNGNPPRVYSIDVNNCYGTLCEERGINRLTLNEKDFGPHRGSAGFFRANLKFFMAADKNQLPIRRVVVDWGDGDSTGGDAEDNFFKNHRGLVDGSTTLSTCDTGSEWGMTDESCDPNFMNYTHTYTCSASILAELDACEGNPASDFGGCKRNEQCVYTPKVHIRDNWGWCASSTVIEGGFWDASPHGALESGRACDYTRNKDSWIYYGGEITVSQ